jgi:hypothetical protein
VEKVASQKQSTNAVEWLGLLLHILEVRGSGLNPEASCPGRSLFVAFFPFLQANAGVVGYLKILHDHFFPTLPQFIIHIYPVIQSCVFEKAPKQKSISYIAR